MSNPQHNTGLPYRSIIDELMNCTSCLQTRELMQILHLRRGTSASGPGRDRFRQVKIGNKYLYDPRQLAAFLQSRLTSL